MTFATLNRKAAPKQTGTDAGRTGVTIVGSGRTRKAVATIRQGNHLMFLGSGTVEYCCALFDAAKAEQQKQLVKKELEKAAQYMNRYSTGKVTYHG